MKIKLWISHEKMDVKNVIADVMKSGANDVPNNGGIARVQGNRTSYCYRIDKKLEI